MSKFDKSGKISHLERWINERRATDRECKPLLYYHPTDNVIIGREAIMTYMSIRSEATFYQYVEILGLPAIKRLDGQWLTTMSAIDQWIFIAAEIDNANRGRSRATNVRLERARERIDRQINRNLEVAKADQRSAEGPDTSSPAGAQEAPLPAQGPSPIQS